MPRLVYLSGLGLLLIAGAFLFTDALLRRPPRDYIYLSHGSCQPSGPNYSRPILQPQPPAPPPSLLDRLRGKRSHTIQP